MPKLSRYDFSSLSLHASKALFMAVSRVSEMCFLTASYRSPPAATDEAYAVRAAPTRSLRVACVFLATAFAPASPCWRTKFLRRVLAWSGEEFSLGSGRLT